MSTRVSPESTYRFNKNKTQTRELNLHRCKCRRDSHQNNMYPLSIRLGDTIQIFQVNPHDCTYQTGQIIRSEMHMRDLGINIFRLQARTLSHVMRKPVYAICEQQRRRSACASAQSDQHLCCSLPR